MQFKDYYSVLGVEPNAGEAEIKSAYRRLARKYHPDVSKEAGAEDKFKAVNEAYEALRDPARRKAYDQLRAGGYRPGDEAPPEGEPDDRGSDWLVLLDPEGWVQLAFQQVPRLRRTTWPDGEVPQQVHLDLTVTTPAELAEQHERALSLGATLLLDRSDDAEEPLYVYADPQGHPFCIFVAPEP